MSYIKDFEDSVLMQEIGINDIEALFSDIPEEARIPGLDLPKGLEEWELHHRMAEIVSLNKRPFSFLGGGVYHHYIPDAVNAIISRGEFLSSYTPYQPEVSQGMLQSIFEYQSQICELTGMEVSNASLYDGSSALGEAALMAARVTRKDEFIIPEAISPDKKNVLQNYVKGAGMAVKEIPFDRQTGQIQLQELDSLVGENTAGVYLESPNYFGVLEESISEIRDTIPGKSLFVAGMHPISLGILEPPGNHGADIVIGEGQSLGIPINLGGPLVGIFTASKKYVRKMPGRIIGMTRDSKGDRAFAMTLMTREQHIRRDKATSNICTNQSLCALAAGTYLALLGRSGLRKIALINLRNGHQLAEKLNSIPGVTAPYFTAPFFNEFTVKLENMDAQSLKDLLVMQRFEPGIPLGNKFPEMEKILLTCSTEVHGPEDHDRLVEVVQSALSY